MPVRSSKTETVESGLWIGSMYAGQFDTISFLSVADTSVALHVRGSCCAPETEKTGSFSAARLAPTKATPPAPLKTVLRERPAPPGAAAIGTPCSRPVRIVSRDRGHDKGFRTGFAPPRRNPVSPRCWTGAGVPVSIGRVTKKQPRAALDDVSKATIEQLQADGRRSYAAIGKVVGLSEAAVRQRVQRLIDAGVMQVVAVTDPLELGFARQAMVGVRVNGPMEPVADALADLDEVDYVVITAGVYDLLVEVVCESDEHLLEVISDKIRRISGVDATETFMYLKLRKQTYSWGVR